MKKNKINKVEILKNALETIGYHVEYYKDLNYLYLPVLDIGFHFNKDNEPVEQIYDKEFKMVTLDEYYKYHEENDF